VFNEALEPELIRSHLRLLLHLGGLTHHRDLKLTIFEEVLAIFKALYSGSLALVFFTHFKEKVQVVELRFGFVPCEGNVFWDVRADHLGQLVFLEVGQRDLLFTFQSSTPFIGVTGCETDFP